MRRVALDGPLIVGGGLAGLSAALECAPRKALLITPAPLLDACSSAWAQGGMAAALAEADSPALHAADTVAAGGGLVDGAAARALTDRGAETVAWLAGLGAPFDRDAHGRFAVSREAAHAVARVARVGGDGAGRAILSALVVAARAAEHLDIWEDARLLALIRADSGRVVGAVVERGGRRVEILAPAVVLATGGIGGLYAVTTTPAALKGEGLAIAQAAGADILDPEFVQFHPTALDIGRDPAPLATEALRGEGARLVDRDGGFLLGADAEADLAPRDQVARAVHRAVTEGRGAFLDTRRAIGDRVARDFPALFAAAMSAGIDPRVSPLPVAPAAHYHMGGIAADTDGRTSVAGLFAVGECAATGVHGANRLASNSLLEAAAFGRRAGRVAATEVAAANGPRLAPHIGAELTAAALAQLRQGMSRWAGVERDASGLGRLIDLIDRLDADAPGAPALAAARMVAEAALERRESRGGHARSDFPDTNSEARHTRLTGAPLPAIPKKTAA
ncbi:L-aspartate oxidase [Brevundimonas sp.]|uniref:L-aspartate oxidase n=1 Tax=Brevundimonas sp. TaxID=1871086 RepID=UPI0035B0975C